VRLEGLDQLKNPVTLLGIEPAIFRLIRCRVPHNIDVVFFYSGFVADEPVDRFNVPAAIATGFRGLSTRSDPRPRLRREDRNAGSTNGESEASRSDSLRK
jgi:hypothetical protein